MDLQVGQLITAPFLPASAEVKKFEPRSGYYLLEVVLQDGHHTYEPLRITDAADDAPQLYYVQNPAMHFHVVGTFLQQNHRPTKEAGRESALILDWETQ
jgi:hypothetical protein